MPGCLCIVPTETALAHARLIGQHRKREVVREMALDPIMQRVTPAEVQIVPSRTKIGSGSTCTAEKRWANLAIYCQWVAARRPSNNPASATRIAPVQTEAMRRACDARFRTQLIRARFSAAA